MLVPAVNVPLENAKLPPMPTLLLPALKVPPAIVMLLSTLTVPLVVIVPLVVFRVGEVLPENVRPLIVTLLVEAPCCRIPPVSLLAVLFENVTPVREDALVEAEEQTPSLYRHHGQPNST